MGSALIQILATNPRTTAKTKAWWVSNGRTPLRLLLNITFRSKFHQLLCLKPINLKTVNSPLPRILGIRRSAHNTPLFRNYKTLRKIVILQYHINFLQLIRNPSSYNTYLYNRSIHRSAHNTRRSLHYLLIFSNYKHLRKIVILHYHINVLQLIKNSSSHNTYLYNRSIHRNAHNTPLFHNYKSFARSW